MEEIEIIAALLSEKRIPKRTAALLLSGVYDISPRPFTDVRRWEEYSRHFQLVCMVLNPAPDVETSHAAYQAAYADCGRGEFISLALKLDPVRGRLFAKAAKLADETADEIAALASEPEPQVEEDVPTSTDSWITTASAIELFGAKHSNALDRCSKWLKPALKVNAGRGAGKGRLWCAFELAKAINTREFGDDDVYAGLLKHRSLNMGAQTYSMVLRHFRPAKED